MSAAMKSLGRGIQYTVKGNKLTMVADLSPANVDAAPLSSTGKSKLPINSGGWVTIPELNGARVMVMGQVGYDGPAAGQKAA